jgi:hypothetical protein
MPPERRSALAPLLFLALAAPYVAGAWGPFVWSWGWDHLGRTSPLWSALVLAIGAAAWLPKVRSGLERAADGIGGAMARRPAITGVVLGAAALALFAAFPIATRIYGDSRYILDDYRASNLAVHVRRMLSFSLEARGSASFVVHELAARLLGISFERSYVLVSVLCGGIFVAAHARFAASLRSTGAWARAAILWLGVTDGATQLFFGHIENYTIVRLFECLFLMEVTGALLATPSRGRRLRAIAWFVLAVFFHSQALVLLPTLLLWIGTDLAARRPRLRPWFPGRVAWIGTLAGIAGIAVVYAATGAGCYDYIYSGGRPEPRQFFLPLTTSCIGLPYLRYTLFSGAHLLDFLGALFSVASPAAVLAIGLCWTGGPRVATVPGPATDARRAGWILLLPSIVFALAHDFILNPAIGFPFDWDLMCVLSPPLLYTAVLLLAQTRERPRSLLPGILFLGLATATVFGVNANPARAYRRAEDMGVWLHRTYYGGSHYRLSSNLSTVADPDLQMKERARVLERLAPRTYPDDREVAFLWERLALLRIEAQDYPGAKEAYRGALTAQPSRWDREKPLGYLESEVGDLAEGIRLLNDYAAHSPGDGEAQLFLGDAQARTGRMDQARRAWIRFLELDPNAPEAPRVRDELRRLDARPGAVPGGAVPPRAASPPPDR